MDGWMDRWKFILALWDSHFLNVLNIKIHSLAFSQSFF